MSGRGRMVRTTTVMTNKLPIRNHDRCVETSPFADQRWFLIRGRIHFFHGTSSRRYLDGIARSSTIPLLKREYNQTNHGSMIRSIRCGRCGRSSMVKHQPSKSTDHYNTPSKTAFATPKSAIREPLRDDESFFVVPVRPEMQCKKN